MTACERMREARARVSRDHVADAYRAGLADRVAAATQRRSEVLQAARDWKDAADEHAHTSFYGAAHVRAMRAYWLGVLRQQRAAVRVAPYGYVADGSHTFHPAESTGDPTPMAPTLAPWRPLAF